MKNWKCTLWNFWWANNQDHIKQESAETIISHLRAFFLSVWIL